MITKVGQPGFGTEGLPKPGQPKKRPQIEAERPTPEEGEAGYRGRQRREKFNLELKKAAEEVVKAIEGFVEKPTLANLEKMKRAVGAFLEAVLAQAFELKFMRLFTEKDEHKVLVLVKVVDEKVAEIGRAFFEGQTKSAWWRALAEELKGVIVDFRW